MTHGWKPECGFLNYGWEGYSEAILLYVLGLGSPTHPLTEESYPAWTVTYQWENLYGHDLLYAGPLFIHQFSHAWIDFRGIRDDFMRERAATTSRTAAARPTCSANTRCATRAASPATLAIAGASPRATARARRRDWSPGDTRRSTAMPRAACRTAPTTGRSAARRRSRRCRSRRRSSCRRCGAWQRVPDGRRRRMDPCERLQRDR